MIHRIDVRSNSSAADPLGQSIRQQILEFGTEVGAISTTRVFLLDTTADAPALNRIASELLADPITEKAELMIKSPDDGAKSRIEIHLKPGVMDPVAASTEMAIRDMGIPLREVRTGRAFLFERKFNRDKLEHIASRVLANGVIESVHFEPYIPREFAQGHDYRFSLKTVPLRDLSEPQLQKLSRDGHLFLSLDEMRAIQSYFREQGREPTDIELETLAQTWSEHCVHKTLKSAVEVEVKDENGKTTGTRKYKNLIKETIFDSTMQLMGKTSSTGAPHAHAGPGSHDAFCLSVFKDNAGVIVFDETDAVCFKVETHNHPSAIEPYGGSATGIGGVIRDILGTGLAAKPIANTDIFCVAFPNYGNTPSSGALKGDPGAPGEPSSSTSNQQLATSNSLPKGVIHPRRILQQIVAGVRDYGNRMGIPTVNGAVYFDDNYLGNPLVFCGCVGLIPRDKVEKASLPGDAIVVMGGRTGRDGIHGATFSSAELTDTHADEFSHAVQIGNAITEKKVGDVILQARDQNLFTAVTDCGAGGLSSAIGEMGEKLGAQVDLDLVPLKYAGLRYDEIWISEAQERMVLSVSPENVEALLALAKSEDVEATVIGHFGTENAEIVLRYQSQEVARMSMDFLHHGIPMPTRKAVVTEARTTPSQGEGRAEGTSNQKLATSNSLLHLLSHPNIASKHWIIRQYDHEVQGGSVIKPLTGPLQVGPSDAAVIRPKLTSYKGVVLACGLAPHIPDPYEMALASIDEAIRNAVAVGADPSKIAILDNFCWPSVDDEQTMGTLVRACEACRDAALAYGIPFISGKDSLHNQFTNQETKQVIRIPNTLLISAIGVINDVRKCVTMDLKKAGSILLHIAPREGERSTLKQLADLHHAVSKQIAAGAILAAHDISDGGLLVAAAEMCIASGLGLASETKSAQDPFVQSRARYLLEVRDKSTAANLQTQLAAVATVETIGRVTAEPILNLTAYSIRQSIADLTKAWRGTLDW